jgi:hypothetical protein
LIINHGRPDFRTLYHRKFVDVAQDESDEFQ